MRASDFPTGGIIRAEDLPGCCMCGDPPCFVVPAHVAAEWERLAPPSSPRALVAQIERHIPGSDEADRALDAAIGTDWLDGGEAL